MKKLKFYFFINIIGYMSTIFFSLLIFQIIIDFSFLKRNFDFVYFDFFLQINFAFFFLSFYLHSLLAKNYIIWKTYKMNIFNFFLGFFFLLKSFFTVMKTSPQFINIQISVCSLNDKKWSFLNLFMESIDFFILFFIWL